jgi:hypothetical protein
MSERLTPSRTLFSRHGATCAATERQLVLELAAVGGENACPACPGPIDRRIKQPSLAHPRWSFDDRYTTFGPFNDPRDEAVQQT